MAVASATPGNGATDVPVQAAGAKVYQVIQFDQPIGVDSSSGALVIQLFKKVNNAYTDAVALAAVVGGNTLQIELPQLVAGTTYCMTIPQNMVVGINDKWSGLPACGSAGFHGFSTLAGAKDTVKPVIVAQSPRHKEEVSYTLGSFAMHTSKKITAVNQVDATTAIVSIAGLPTDRKITPSQIAVSDSSVTVTLDRKSVV